MNHGYMKSYCLRHTRATAVQQAFPKTTDPVCMMKVHLKNPHGDTCIHDDITYYSCGPLCNRAFQKDQKECLPGRKKVDT